MRRTLRTALTGMAALMVAGAGWGAPVSRIWAVNLGSDPMEVKVERAQDGIFRVDTLLVGPDKVAEVQRSGDEEVQIADDPDLLLVTAPTGFDPASLQVGGASPGSEDPGERRPAAREKAARAETRLARGETASSTVLWTGAEPLAVRVVLHGSPAFAEVRVTGPDGPPLGYVTLAASREVEVTVDLRSFLDRNQYWGPVKKEVSVRRGEASASLSAPARREGAGALQKAVGAGSFNHHIDHTAFGPVSSPLYYSVTGGPASTCGELNTYRNGSWLFGPGWLCTNASGSATKGPWYTANGNQTDNPAFIRWPNGTTTTNDWHIWDNNCPKVTINPGPPSSFSGTATDTQWGSCFSAGARIETYFLDRTTGLMWSSSTGTYSAASGTHVYSPLTNTPGCSSTWSVTPPPLSAHIPGHQYHWTACAWDAGCGACSPYLFTY